MKKIQDFGEKIGGARKDLWRTRGYLIQEDLYEMEERELRTLVVKDQIWPCPDYQQLVADGMDPVCALFMKNLRDSLPQRLTDKHNNIESASDFIELLNLLRTTCLKTLKEENLKDFLNESLIKGEYLEKTGFRRWQWLKSGYGLTKSLFLKCIVDDESIKRLKGEVLLHDFPTNYFTELKGGYLVICDDKTKFFHPKRYPNGKSFQTSSEAIEFAKKEFCSEKKAATTTRKSTYSFVRPQLAGINRTGDRFRLKDVTPNDMLKTFAFRGGEFGTWNTEKDKQACLNYAYDAFCDLAQVLDIPTECLKLGGYKDLAIAFGARGHSKACAHYEPEKVVINLTKLKGAGCLAHEFGHALDDFLGYKFRNKTFFSLRLNTPMANYPELSAAASNLYHAIYYKKLTLEEKKQYRMNSRLSAIEYFVKDIKNRMFDTPAALEKFNTLILRLLQGAEVIEDISNLYHETTGEHLTSGEVENLSNFLGEGILTPEAERYLDSISTDFIRNVTKADIGKTKKYYSTIQEIFARCFEAYIEDSLTHRSDYLVYGTNDKKIYPSGNERIAINQAMKEFLSVVKTIVWGDVKFNMKPIETTITSNLVSNAHISPIPTSILSNGQVSLLF